MTPRVRLGLLVLALVAAGTGASLIALELKPATLAAFNRYITLTEARMDGEVRGASPFLWLDRQPAANRASLQHRLSQGEVVVEHLETRDAGAEIFVKDGLIHHWIGTVLLPGVTIDQAIQFVKRYERYPDHFSPIITRSSVLKQTGDHFEVSMRTTTTKMITVVIDADYIVDYHALGTSRVWTRSTATNIREIESAGQPNERAKVGDAASGYLWRLNNYCAFEQRPEGTYEQCESISLSRDLPFGVAWMIKPFLSSVPRDTLAFTLGRVRAGTAAR